jgi:hypothetical protein
MTTSAIFGSTGSTEQASSIGREAGSVVVVVTLALELLSSGAAAS